jgi:hypothetical protein
MQMALREGPVGPAGSLPEADYARIETTSALPAGVLVAGGALVAAGIWMAARQKGKSS